MILGKYLVSYYLCDNCGFYQTEEPFWLEESYLSPIADTDIGQVSRNLLMAQKTKALISVFFDSNAKFLDFGAGTGLFVRLMRDAGCDYYYYDKFSDNIFANRFQKDL